MTKCHKALRKRATPGSIRTSGLAGPVLFLSLTVQVGIAQATNEREPLSGEEIRSLIIGNSITGTPQSQGPFTMYVPAEGEMRGLRGHNYRDSGTWRVTENEICVKWRKWWAAAERCWQVFVDGDKVSWIRADGRLSDSARLVKGNPEEL